MLYRRLKNGGFYVEVLTKPYSCANVDASKYAALLLIDTEDFFTEKEMQLIRHDIEN